IRMIRLTARAGWGRNPTEMARADARQPIPKSRRMNAPPVACEYPVTTRFPPKEKSRSGQTPVFDHPRRSFTYPEVVANARACKRGTRGETIRRDGIVARQTPRRGRHRAETTSTIEHYWPALGFGSLRGVRPVPALEPAAFPL